MARMLGNARPTGCAFGKKCTCNGMYRDKATKRSQRRREVSYFKKEIAFDLI